MLTQRLVSPFYSQLFFPVHVPVPGKFFFITSSNLRCMVRLYRLLALIAHDLSQARSEMENEPSRYFIQCQ